MELAAYTVPKINAETGEIARNEGGGLFFCSAEEGVNRAFARYPSGKILLFSGGREHALLAPFACNPRALSVVSEGEDCLPLFSMPDGISCVVAAGERGVLRAARFFAGVRGIACVLVPVDYTLRGAYEVRGAVRVGETEMEYPLAQAEVYCDASLFPRSLFRAHARLALSRLALFEMRALNVFRRTGLGEAYERAYGACSRLSARLTAEQIVRANAVVRRCENFGVLSGECAVLSDFYEEAGEPFPEWRAYSELSALYSAFYLRGKPRKFYLPDYKGRCTAVQYAAAEIPTAEEYARRALALERTRGEMTRELRSIARECSELPRLLRISDSSERLSGGNLHALKYLPERCPLGLSAIIRDFGLMDWSEDLITDGKSLQNK